MNKKLALIAIVVFASTHSLVKATDVNVIGSVTASQSVVALGGYVSGGTYVYTPGYVVTGTYVYAGSYLKAYSQLFVGPGTATASYAAAIGQAPTNQSYSSFVVGRYNKIEGTPGSWNATVGALEPLLVAGNGTDASHPNNAFAVYKDGTVTMSQAQGDILMGQFGN